jgi:hypothetical protein
MKNLFFYSSIIICLVVFSCTSNTEKKETLNVATVKENVKLDTLHEFTERIQQAEQDGMLPEYLGNYAASGLTIEEFNNRVSEGLQEDISKENAGYYAASNKTADAFKKRLKEGKAKGIDEIYLRYYASSEQNAEVFKERLKTVSIPLGFLGAYASCNLTTEEFYKRLEEAKQIKVPDFYLGHYAVSEVNFIEK